MRTILSLSRGCVAASSTLPLLGSIAHAQARRSGDEASGPVAAGEGTPAADEAAPDLAPLFARADIGGGPHHDKMSPLEKRPGIDFQVGVSAGSSKDA